LEKEQKQYTLDRFLAQLDRGHLLIRDELGYVTMSRGGLELLFRVFRDRYERGSILVASNLPFNEWGQIFQGEWALGHSSQAPRFSAPGTILARFGIDCAFRRRRGSSVRRCGRMG
jgi:DNA replication protein DnaC